MDSYNHSFTLLTLSLKFWAIEFFNIISMSFSMEYYQVDSKWINQLVIHSINQSHQEHYNKLNCLLQWLPPYFMDVFYLTPFTKLPSLIFNSSTAFIAHHLHFFLLSIFLNVFINIWFNFYMFHFKYPPYSFRHKKFQAPNKSFIIVRKFSTVQFLGFLSIVASTTFSFII